MRRTRWMHILIMGLLLLPSAAQSKDTTFRCGRDLIGIGDSKSRVFYLCGEPLMKEVIGLTKVPNNKAGIEFIVERWTYDTSTRYFTILTFKGDRLVNLEDERKY